MKRLKVWFNDGTEEIVSDEAKTTTIKENALLVYSGLENPDDGKWSYVPYRKLIVAYSLYSIKKWQWIENERPADYDG